LGRLFEAQFTAILKETIGAGCKQDKSEHNDRNHKSWFGSFISITSSTLSPLSSFATHILSINMRHFIESLVIALVSDEAH